MQPFFEIFLCSLPLGLQKVKMLFNILAARVVQRRDLVELDVTAAEEFLNRLDILGCKFEVSVSVPPFTVVAVADEQRISLAEL